MAYTLAEVDDAVKFLERVTKDHAHKLEAMKSHEELVKLASENGHKVTRETLAAGMKVLVDRAAAQHGIPSWVRDRLHVMVHD